MLSSRLGGYEGQFGEIAVNLKYKKTTVNATPFVAPAV